MEDAIIQLQTALAGRYSLTDQLGEGASATVYLCHDVRHDRQVALKVLRPAISAVLGPERFLREIRVTASFNHPNITPLYDSGEAAGHLYYVMPVVEGESLRWKLERERQLGLEEALAIVRAVADGLDYAHEHNVVHRDIKPENILLHRGVAQIADFGIAGAIRRVGGERLTATGISLGTPAYMSPEQAAGDRTVGPASDVYSLATVLYEMLAGDPPFTGSHVQAVVTKILLEPPPRLSQLRPGLPPELCAAVDRALSKVPGDRFPRAGDFAAALTAVLRTPGAQTPGARTPVAGGPPMAPAARLEELWRGLGDRYGVVRELGSGGMATVFLARDLRHGRDVAIKVLRPEVAATLGVDRFLREIRIAAGLNHPNILPLFDSGELAGLLYFVMPYVAGESLRGRLRREGRLPVRDVVRILYEICDALAAAHEQGVVHRDLKPENILLSERHALLADFGVAKAMSEAMAERSPTTGGVAMGTPHYMAPEQAAADPRTDQRADLFALGVIGYEMLTGGRPFQGDTAAEVLSASLTLPPAPLDADAAIPASLAQVIMRCLEKRARDRWPDATALLEALETVATEVGGVTPAGTPPHPAPGRRRWPLIAATASIGVLVVSAVAWLARAPADPGRWLRDVAIPEIERLQAAGLADSALVLAQRAARQAPGDPDLVGLVTALSWVHPVTSDPSGARVYRKPFPPGDHEWRLLGVTPLDTVRFPITPSLLRLERDGYRPVLALIAGYEGRVHKLDPPATLPERMVRVEGWTATIGGEPTPLQDFFLDRYEVTNREYKEFVDAGGYRQQRFWRHPFVLDGRSLTWEQAMDRLVDRTGRPGPATWQVGTYPDGHDDHPVGGLSWYEAAAFAEFAGRSLPTVHHWRRAFGAQFAGHVLPASNIETDGPAPVGAFAGIGPFGTFDMAGNAREWTHNESAGQRFILGGGWNDPDYLGLNTMYRQPAFDRSSTNGIRLASYQEAGAELDRAHAPLVTPAPVDFRSAQPVPDEVFAVFRRQFEYDPLPLDARIEQADTARHWIRQRITFATAYDDDRVTLYLFLPRDGNPPYQTILYFPGSSALRFSHFDEWKTVSMDFLPRSGRAVAFPVLKHTFERGHGAVTGPNPSNLYRDAVIHWAKDVRRTMDYVATRSDLDPDRWAFYGFSWGGRMGPVMVAAEPRFKAAVLYVAGFNDAPRQQEVDEIHYLPRVRLPVLMMNGRLDDVFPLETHARPFFDLLGTPDQHKRFVISEGGHFVPLPQLIGETLDWLDRYLGPVGAPDGAPAGEPRPASPEPSSDTGDVAGKARRAPAGS
jgi:eukaryotic-like serine/threonine-protein kinase